MKLESQAKQSYAPGSPGISPRWSSSAKSGIGKAMKASSDVSFTISHGILNEVYYPWEDEACIRDMGFLVADGKDFFSEEKKDTRQEIKMTSPGIPAYLLMNTCIERKYTITKEIIADPIRNTILHRVKFKPIKGRLADYHLFILVTPHLGNQGADNSGWVGNYKGVPMIFAKRDQRALALACSIPWIKRSVGFIGYSDGWQDIHQHKSMKWEYQYAEHGNIALIGQIDLSKSEGQFILALGFGHNSFEAAYSARGSLLSGYQVIRKQYISEWRNWQRRLMSAKSLDSKSRKYFRISASVLRMHEANRVPGAIIASMSIPWGETRGDEDTGGYHMVWPRDLVESSGGMIALHAKEDTLRILTYLMTTQEEDGHWVQNMWLQGRPHWEGIQMDQTALPIILIDLFRHHGILKSELIPRYWLTVKKALKYLVLHGPYTEQDRWERDGGLSIFTVASEIAALIAGADFADQCQEPQIATYCRELADCWNQHIESWFYVTQTPLTDKYKIEGYYVRLNHEGKPADSMKNDPVYVYNNPEETSRIPAGEMISPDALALVRFGLRDPHDLRILNTLKVIDATLMVKTPNGPCWHRYTRDGFGEHEDGSPYNGIGIGRAWPLLTGERAHYEIAAGNLDKAEKLAKAMEAFSNNGLFPEQIWDMPDIPDKELFFGKNSGSAMPLVWAHAEYIKLCQSLKQRAVFDMPLNTQKRYVKNTASSSLEIWRPDHPIAAISKDHILRIESQEDAVVHWSTNQWQNYHDTPLTYSGLGIYYMDMPIFERTVVFTLFLQNKQEWIHKDFKVVVE